jgi:CHAT domain-containing protein
MAMGSPVAVTVVPDSEAGSEEVEEGGDGAADAEEAAPAEVEEAFSSKEEEFTPEIQSFVSSELETVGRLFVGGVRAMKTGEEATRAAWKESSATARYIHLTDLAQGPDGGFMLADGPLSIAEIRQGTLVADLVVITAIASPEVQMRRARTFLDIGARAVVVSTWDMDPVLKTRFLSSFYESLHQDRTPARALAEARQVLQRDVSLGARRDNPALWGSFMLVGKP